MAHLVFKVDLPKETNAYEYFCTVPELYHNAKLKIDKLTKIYGTQLKDLDARCYQLIDELKEIRAVWQNDFNNRRKKSRSLEEVVPQSLYEPNPYFVAHPRTRRQIGVLDILFGASLLYSHFQLKGMIETEQNRLDNVIQVLQEEDTRLSINERSLHILNETTRLLLKEHDEIKSHIETEEAVIH